MKVLPAALVVAFAPARVRFAAAGVPVPAAWLILAAGVLVAAAVLVLAARGDRPVPVRALAAVGRRRCAVTAALAGTEHTYCHYCRKRIFKAKNGDWYHVRSGSVSCSPGAGSDRRALPAAGDARETGA